jgi:signal transduction histidine kinase
VLNPWMMLIAGAALGAAGAALAARWSVRRGVQRVREAERRARGAERLAELGAMTGGLAHEIKNPLSTIGLNAQLLAEGVEELNLDEETRGRLSRRVGALRREVDRLKGILTDFLEYAGELRLDRSPADVNEVVSELVDFFLPQAEKQGVRLRADLGPGPIMSSIDVPHVKQALLNLMLNAVQAMSANPEGTPRELILKTLLITPREAGAGVGGKPQAHLHIIDTGPGMSDETMEKMWRPYFTTKSGGTGLGLPTTRRIVEAHGGRIDVHSEIGRGTDFAIVLDGAPVLPAARASI